MNKQEQRKYGFRFQYRETKESEVKTDCIFFTDSLETRYDLWNQCEMRMLHHIKKCGYYSGKLISTLAL